MKKVIISDMETSKVGPKFKGFFKPRPTETETVPQTNWQTNKDGNNKVGGREVICINIYITRSLTFHQTLFYFNLFCLQTKFN